MTRTLLPHERDRSLGEIDDAEQIRLDLGAYVFEARIFDRADIAIARIVHEYIETGEPLDRRRDGITGPMWIGDVEGEGVDLMAIALRQIVQLCGIARGGHQLAACGKHGFRERPAQTTGAARYQPDLGHGDSPGPGKPVSFAGPRSMTGVPARRWSAKRAISSLRANQTPALLRAYSRKRSSTRIRPAWPEMRSCRLTTIIRRR